MIPLIDKPLIIRAEPLLKPQMVKINLMKNIATVGEIVHVEIHLNSGLERVWFITDRVCTSSWV